jgi:hypothetical protein
MRIFTLRRMFGLAVVATAYVHGKRGGDATFASISDTVQYLWGQATERLGLGRPPARVVTQRPNPAKQTTPNGIERHPPRPSNG